MTDNNFIFIDNHNDQIFTQRRESRHTQNGFELCGVTFSHDTHIFKITCANFYWLNYLCLIICVPPPNHRSRFRCHLPMWLILLYQIQYKIGIMCGIGKYGIQITIAASVFVWAIADDATQIEHSLPGI